MPTVNVNTNINNTSVTTVINNVITTSSNNTSISSYQIEKTQFLARIPHGYSNDFTFLLKITNPTSSGNTHQLNTEFTNLNNLSVRCTSVTLPQIQLETMEIPQPGFPVKVASKITTGEEITVTIIDTHDLQVFKNIQKIIEYQFNHKLLSVGWNNVTIGYPSVTIEQYLPFTNNTTTPTGWTTKNQSLTAPGIKVFEFEFPRQIIKTLPHHTVDYTTTEFVTRDIAISYDYFYFRILNGSNNLINS